MLIFHVSMYLCICTVSSIRTQSNDERKFGSHYSFFIITFFLFHPLNLMININHEKKLYKELFFFNKSLHAMWMYLLFRCFYHSLSHIYIYIYIYIYRERERLGSIDTESKTLGNCQFLVHAIIKSVYLFCSDNHKDKKMGVYAIPTQIHMLYQRYFALFMHKYSKLYQSPTYIYIYIVTIQSWRDHCRHP